MRRDWVALCPCRTAIDPAAKIARRTVVRRRRASCCMRRIIAPLMRARLVHHFLDGGNTSMWNRDEVRGKADQVKGRAKQAVGDLSDDERLKNEGEADEAAGKAQETIA